jgi:hypothetical protein
LILNEESSSWIPRPFVLFLKLRFIFADCVILLSDKCFARSCQKMQGQTVVTQDEKKGCNFFWLRRKNVQKCFRLSLLMSLFDVFQKQEKNSRRFLAGKIIHATFFELEDDADAALFSFFQKKNIFNGHTPSRLEKEG